MGPLVVVGPDCRVGAFPSWYGASFPTLSLKLASTQSQLSDETSFALTYL